MKKILLTAFAVSCLAGGHGAFAQRVSPVKSEQERHRVAEELREKHQFNREKALRLAREKNWVIQKVEADGSVISLQGVDEKGLPMYHTTYHNTRAAASIRTHEVWSGGLLGLNLNGASPALAGKLGLWDGGAVRATHQELTGRIVNRDGATALSDHATHVAGTMIATGVNALAKGMSHQAKNLQSWDFNNDIPEMVAAAGNLLISNHSYGSISGWRLNGSTWEFWGAPNENEDFKFGQYNSQARDWDVITNQHPYYLPVKSAGNNRSQNGPAVGQPYSRFNTQGLMAPAGNRPAGISSNDGYDIISTYGTAKNILTVGAVEPIPNSYQQPSDVKISSFSSWGPTDDGRIKPDIVGNGVSLLSSYSTADDAYASISGTSMSSPNVSGSLNLLQEHFSNLNGGAFMRAATLKGLVLHTADEAGPSPGPDYVYGWGLLNTSRAAQVIGNTKGTNLLQEKELAQGQTHSIQVTASGAGPLVVTIAWTDPEAVASTTLNDRSLKLVNDLDVRVLKNGTTFMPWVLDPANPSFAATFGDNIRDNVEQVLVGNAVPGETYTITVQHKGTLARGPQAYSIIVSGIGGAAVCTSAAQSSADSKITNVTFGNINNTPSTSCTTYADFTAQVTELEIGQAVPLKVTTGTCGVDFNKVAKVFIDWNADGDFEDAGEEVAASGVLTGNAEFETSVQVPTSVVAGNSARMRVVLVETGDASAVAACGDYAKGETQDYRVRFIPSSTDVGVIGLLSPENGFCANPAQGGVAVLLKNFGTAPKTDIPVQVVIRNGSAVVATLSTTYTRSLAPFSEAKVTLPGTFEAEVGQTYTFTASASLAGDANPANDQVTASRSAAGETGAPVATAAICGNDEAVLRGSGNGTIFWYDALQGGNLVAAGNNTFTSFKPANNTYYAALNEFAGKVGPASKAAFTGGGYNQFGPSILFTAKVPFVIEKARLYIGNPGTITFTVETLSGSPVSSVTLEVAATRTVAGPGAQANDPNDQGAVYDLNLKVPGPGNYQISINYGDGATIFRSNAGVTGYPFEIPNVLSITGNSAGPNFYYYLYDMQVKALGCPGPRVAVPAETVSEATAQISVDGPTTICEGQTVVLNAEGTGGAGMTYAWRLNGNVIPGATGASYGATASGNYTLTVTNSNGCFKTSAPVAVQVNQMPTVANIAAASSTELCAGEPVSVLLRAVTNVTTVVTYQWLKDGVEIPSATASTYRATQTGKFTVQISSAGCGSLLSSPVAITQEDPNITAANAVICNASGAATLTALSSFGNLFWYDAATGGNLVGTGSSFTTPNLTASTSYFVGLNDLQGSAGSPANNVNGSMSTFTGGRMYFDAEVPFTLEKATINVATAGTMTVIIVDKDHSNAIIASRTISVTVGVKEYDVNLFVPKAGKNYGLQVSNFGPAPGATATAAAYRNNTAGSVHFPYAVPGIMALTGTNQADQTAFYYFLYNMKVKAAGCATATRKQVDVIVNPAPVAQAVAEKPVVYYGYAPEASTALHASATSGREPYTYKWSTGATTASVSVSPTATTTYTVTVTDALGCTSAAEVKVEVVDVRCGTAKSPKVVVCQRTGRVVCVEAKDVPDHLKNGGSLGACPKGAAATVSSQAVELIEGISVAAYPNPFSSSLTIDILPEEAEYLTFEVFDIRGALVKRLYAGNAEAGKLQRLQLDGNSLPEGIYVGRLISKGKAQTLKLVLKK